MALKNITLAASAALAGTMLMPSAAHAYDGYYDDNRYESRYDDRYDRRYDGRDYRRGDYYEGRRYRRGDYYEGRRYSRRHYRGRCRDNGTGGTVIGGIAGALLGREIGRGSRDRYGRRGDGTAGAIIGGVAGALAGRAIDRDC